jgi:hypothetical protein
MKVDPSKKDKDFVGSLYIPKEGGYYTTFTPKEGGIVERYDSQTKEKVSIQMSSFRD